MIDTLLNLGIIGVIVLIIGFVISLMIFAVMFVFALKIISSIWKDLNGGRE